MYNILIDQFKKLNLLEKIKDKRKIKLNKNKFFISYKEALEYCENNTKNAYENINLSKYRFEKTNNFLSNNENILKAPFAPLLMFVINLFLTKFEGKTPSFIDFGGACGESIILLKKLFGDEIQKKSWIIESPQIVKESKEWKFTENINFSSQLMDVVSENKIDIFFTSGTIQSIKNPYEIISNVARSNIPFIALTRNNFAENEIISAQISRLSDNGIGSHLEKYKDELIYYPNTTIIKKTIIDLFKENGYSLLFDSKNNTDINKTESGGDLVFLKI
tara:strand:+ start:44 stop:874 length:831 start_codon:yes stop_codon:yes gene_type:complete